MNVSITFSDFAGQRVSAALYVMAIKAGKWQGGWSVVLNANKRHLSLLEPYFTEIDEILVEGV